MNPALIFVHIVCSLITHTLKVIMIKYFAHFCFKYKFYIPAVFMYSFAIMILLKNVKWTHLDYTTVS